MSNEGLEFKQITFNIKKIMDALKLGDDPEKVKEIFRDGRTSSRFTEDWASQYYDLDHTGNSNNPSYDLFKISSIGKVKISVKSLTKSVRFQDSRYVGSGRSCSRSELHDSIMKVDYYIICDISSFPVVKMMPIDVKYLLELFTEKKISIGGMPYKSFYKNVIQRFYNKVKIQKFS